MLWPEVRFIVSVLSRKPSADLSFLQVDKLYGHPFELVSVTSAHSLPIIATACKATAPEHALIRVYSTETWQPVGVPLEGHSLTITKLAFSPPSLQDTEADRWLLSVSRDRTWNVYERASADGEGAFHVPCSSFARGTDRVSMYAEPTYRRAANAKSHARIIWDACWGEDATFFATASRDKTVRSLAFIIAELKEADDGSLL